MPCVKHAGTCILYLMHIDCQLHHPKRLENIYTSSTPLRDKCAQVLTQTDCDLIFTKVKTKGARKINFAEFGAALEQVAAKKKVLTLLSYLFCLLKASTLLWAQWFTG